MSSAVGPGCPRSGPYFSLAKEMLLDLFRIDTSGQLFNATPLDWPLSDQDGVKLSVGRIPLGAYQKIMKEKPFSGILN